jgi:predicted nucleic acid-binding protein
MTDAVFDTTVFIDSYKGIAGAVSLVEDVIRGHLAAWYSPIVVYELWVRPMDRSEEFFHSATLALLREAPVSSREARQVADWLRGSPRAQRLRLAADAMIAATAASIGATIFTRNPRDFTRFYTDVKSC